jgi:ribonuclease PH
LICPVAAISVGIVRERLLLDLCYEEDFSAEVDFNVVLTSKGGLVELQGATEANPFPRRQVQEVLALAYRGLEPIFEIQREATRAL